MIIEKTQQESLVLEKEPLEPEPFQPMTIIRIEKWVRIPGTDAHFRGVLSIGDKAVRFPDRYRLPGEMANHAKAVEFGDFDFAEAEIRLRELFFGKTQL